MAALVDDADREIADEPNSMKGHRACLTVSYTHLTLPTKA